MRLRPLLAIGLVLLFGGLVAVAIGAIFPSSDPLVALGWLLLVPLLVSLCGAVLVFVGLARRTLELRWSAVAHRIVGMSAVAGLGLALGYGALGILSQVPDTLAGLNGAFVPGSAPGLGALILGGVGVAVGLLIGAEATLARWLLARRARA